MTYWLFLFTAIFFGVFGTLCMKLSGGLKRWKPTVSLFVFYLLSFIAMTYALQGMEMSFVYAIWSGVGTILIAIIGYFVFDESMSLSKIISLFLIVMGVFGIHLSNVIH